MKVRRTEILTRAALIVVVVVIGLNAWLAYRSVEILDESHNWVAHTGRVINTLERVMSSLKDAESGERGFLLTGNAAYMGQYTKATTQITQDFRDLRALSIDNPQREAEIKQMQTLINSRLKMLQNGIDQRRAGNQSQAKAIIESGAGKAEMDRLRAMTRSMQNDERRILAGRIASSSRDRIDSQLTILIISAIDILLLILVVWFMGHERALRHKATAAADRLTKLQFISDVALTRLALDDLVRALLDRLRNVIRADGVVFCHWNGGEIEVVASTGVASRRGLRIKLTPDSPLYQAAASRKLVTVEGAAARDIPLVGMRREMSSALILPVVTAGETAALLVAGRHSGETFEDQDENLLTLVADRIGMASDRAKAYEAEREARHLAEKSAAEVQALNAELEQRVELRTAQLAASNRELEAFSYSVSHDLRSPLRSVDGFSLALEEDFASALNDEGRDFIRRIRAGVQKMGQLIDSLLQLSRITRGELTRERISVSDLAADVAHDLRVANPRRNLTFRIQPDIQADADPRLLRIALENLLGNAVKFTALQPEALIEFGRSQQTGEFFIRDNGAGFDMKYSDKLFQAFQRLHGEREFQGSGIGLATVARVIRRHMGAIRAESAPGQGATFWFTVG